jgi:molybdate transport repressor ModE-like protein
MDSQTLDARFAQLRLRDLMLLEHLAELGSLRAAAERLHVSQPAVTQALQGLEAAFGTALVERGRRGQRGVRLTAAGAGALARLKVARHELTAARSAAREPAVLPLRIGVLPLAMLALMPAALARLRARLPEVRVSFTEGTVAHLWSLLALGELDAVVCRLPAVTEHTPLPPGIRHWTVGEERMALCGARRHPAAKKRRITLKDLTLYDWVGPPTGSFTRLVFDQLFVRAGLAPPEPVVTSLSFHSNLQLVKDGLLLTVAPESAVRRYAGALDLKVLATPWHSGDAGVVLACRASSVQHPAVSALLASFALVP